MKQERHQLASYPLRIAPELREALQRAADQNLRSLNAEIVARLTAAPSLRDDFAAKALPAVVSSWLDLGFKPGNELSFAENTALCAYQLAEAMLKARAQ